MTAPLPRVTDLTFLRDRAVFSVFRRAAEVPIYRIVKAPSLARKLGLSRTTVQDRLRRLSPRAGLAVLPRSGHVLVLDNGAYCKRAAKLTRQLLAFARRQTIAPRELDLNETVEGMLKMLRRLIGEDIRLVTECEPSAGWVMANRGLMDQSTPEKASTVKLLLSSINTLQKTKCTTAK